MLFLNSFLTLLACVTLVLSKSPKRNSVRVGESRQFRNSTETNGGDRNIIVGSLASEIESLVNKGDLLDAQQGSNQVGSMLVKTSQSNSSQANSGNDNSSNDNSSEGNLDNEGSGVVVNADSLLGTADLLDGIPSSTAVRNQITQDIGLISTLRKTVSRVAAANRKTASPNDNSEVEGALGTSDLLNNAPTATGDVDSLLSVTQSPDARSTGDSQGRQSNAGRLTRPGSGDVSSVLGDASGSNSLDGLLPSGTDANSALSGARLSDLSTILSTTSQDQLSSILTSALSLTTPGSLDGLLPTNSDGSPARTASRASDLSGLLSSSTSVDALTSLLSASGDADSSVSSTSTRSFLTAEEGGPSGTASAAG